MHKEYGHHSLLIQLESEIAEVTSERQTKDEQKPFDMEKMKAYVQYFLAHLDELLLYHSNPVLQAKYFGVIFNDAPTYDDIVSGTPDCSGLTGVNIIFKPKKLNQYSWLGRRFWNRTFDNGEQSENLEHDIQSMRGFSAKTKLG